MMLESKTTAEHLPKPDCWSACNDHAGIASCSAFTMKVKPVNAKPVVFNALLQASDGYVLLHPADCQYEAAL